MSLLADDLDCLLSDTVFASAVSCGSVATRGQLSESDEIQMLGDHAAQVRITTLIIRTGTLGAIAADATVTVDGTDYRVDAVRPHGSTKQRLLLARTP